jgi:hypothetical protein
VYTGVARHQYREITSAVAHIVQGRAGVVTVGGAVEIAAPSRRLPHASGHVGEREIRGQSSPSLVSLLLLLLLKLVLLMQRDDLAQRHQTRRGHEMRRQTIPRGRRLMLL